MVHIDITENIYCKLYAAKSRLNCILFFVLAVPPVLRGFGSLSGKNAGHIIFISIIINKSYIVFCHGFSFKSYYYIIILQKNWSSYVVIIVLKKLMRWANSEFHRCPIALLFLCSLDWISITMLWVGISGNFNILMQYIRVVWLRCCWFSRQWRHQTAAPNDTAYMRWSCHSVLAHRCANRVDPRKGGPIHRVLGKQVMRTRWMAGTAPHKSVRCRD